VGLELEHPILCRIKETVAAADLARRSARGRLGRRSAPRVRRGRPCLSSQSYISSRSSSPTVRLAADGIILSNVLEDTVVRV
jgi:hypothetical protein